MPKPQDIGLVTCARLPTPDGEFQLCLYRDPIDHKEHLAIVMGDLAQVEGVLVRLHSECFTGDVLQSQRCDCGEQLHRALRAVAGEGRGVVLYLRQEGRGIGLGEKLRAYNLQDQGLDTVDANLALGHQADERDYGAAARILRHLGPKSIRLLTNNPHKIDSLRALGIEVVGRIPLLIDSTGENKAYLETKRNRMNHWIHLDPNPTPPVRRPSRDR
ncbi:MAG TPA: GTP cyclohydrolase II [Anaerolineales bacterium]|nr:GTP cyclohydrolase II [Anaerolineales bacterium]